MDLSVLGAVECTRCQARTVQSAIGLWSDVLHARTTVFVTVDGRRVLHVWPKAFPSRDHQLSTPLETRRAPVAPDAIDTPALLAIYDISEEFLRRPREPGEDSGLN